MINNYPIFDKYNVEGFFDNDPCKREKCICEKQIYYQHDCEYFKRQFITKHKLLKRYRCLIMTLKKNTEILMFL